MTKLYERTRFKNTMQRKLENRKLSPNVDILMYLNFIIFLEKLAKEAQKNTLERNTTVMIDSDIDECLEDILRQFRG